MKKRALAAFLLASALLFSASTAAFAESENEEVPEQDPVAEEEITPEETVPETESDPAAAQETPEPEAAAEEELPASDPDEEESDDAEAALEEELPADDIDTLAVDGTEGETTSVKIEWTITDVSVTESKGYTWDADNLQWVESDTYTATDGSASFTFTNYGTAAVQASVSFVPAEGMADVINGDVTYVNNNCALGTSAAAGETETQASQTITATVPVNADKFTGITDSGILGTYTASITADSAE